MTAPAVPWSAPPAPDTTVPPIDPAAQMLASTLDSLIALGAATSARSLQTQIGSSELGHDCGRRIAYKLRGVPPTNFRDPLRALVGTGLHLALADLFERLGYGSGRWLVEQDITYDGVPGTVDLYDRHTHTVIDFKSTLKDKLRRIRRDGPPRPYVVQVQTYAAGLKALGEDPQRVALAYLPVDGELSDLWCWVAPVDLRVAQEAVERLERLRAMRPEHVPAVPDRLCPWCHHHRPGSTNLAVGCPGQETGKS